MGFVLAAVAAAAAFFSHSQARSSSIHLLYHHSGTVAAFAQDGPEVAWFQDGGNECNTVHILSLADGLHTTLPDQSARNVTCRFVWDPRRPVGLAFARSVGTGSTLWSLPQRSPLQLDYLLGAGLTPTDRAERRFLEVAHTARGVGQWLGGIAGDGPTLAYGVTSVDYQDEAGCLAGTDPAGCTLVKSGGGVYRISGRNPMRVPNTLPAVAVAASGPTIAYVATGAISKDGRPRPTATLPIEIVDATTGAEIASVVPQGIPTAIALAPHVLATLERTPLGLRLAWYDSTTGETRGSVPVPAATAPSLTASDQFVVFRVGRSLRAVATGTHRLRVLARLTATPLGLSLEGGRLAWAENLRGSYRIRAIYVTGKG